MKYQKLLRMPLALGLLFVTTSATAQSRFIRGKISGSDGDPVDGATIKVVESQATTTSKSDGTFAIAVLTEDKTLEISANSYKTQRVAIPTGTDNIDVVLEEDPLGIDAVNITAVGIKKEKRSLGFASTQVNGADAAQGRDRSAFNGLQGKVAGLYITSGGGTPGSSTRIQLRGVTSLNGDNQPLIVVDGIPIDNSSLQNADNLNHQVDVGNRANDINPDDIESINVLKGPAAAVLYGSRASNGAIIITTKSGKGSIGANNKLSMTYSSSYSFERILRLPKFQNEFGQGGYGQPDTRENWSWGPKFDGTLKPWGQEVDGEQRVKPYSALPNNVRDFFNTGHTFQNNLSVNGGGDKMGYFFSFGDLRNTSIIPGTEYRRNTIKGNAYTQLANNFYSNVSVTYSHTNSFISTQGQDYSFYDQILQTPRDIPLTENEDLNNKFNTLSGYYGAYTLNPYYILATSGNKNVVDNVLGVGTLGYKYKNWLDLTYRFGSNFYTDSRYGHEPKIEGITGQNASQTSKLGLYTEDVYRISEITSDLIANAKRDITKDIKLNVVIGHNIRQRTTNYTNAQTAGLVIPGYYNMANSDGRPVVDNSYTRRRIVGVYGDVGVSYKDWLFLNLTGRNDWSSTLPVSKRSYFYPGASLAWIFSSTFKMPKWMTYGKMRLATATVGKDAEPYLLSSVFVTGSVGDGYSNSLIRSPYGSVTGYERGNRIGNPNLKPEFTTSNEVGLELAFFKGDRLGLDMAYYVNKTKDIILNVPIAPSTGFTSQTINAASFTNKGFELLVRTTPIMKKNFRWNLNFVYSQNKNTVTDLYPGIEQVSLGGLSSATVVAAVGRQFGEFYAIGTMKTPDGKTVVDSATGMPLTNSQPQYYGSYYPKNTFSITNTFKFKNWQLYVQIDRKNGGMMYSRTKDIMEFVGATENTLNINGSGTNRDHEVLANSVYQTYDGKYAENKVAIDPNDYWIDQKDFSRSLLDASYTKLREVTISYALPAKWLGKTPFGSAMLGVSGRNLLLWTPAENIFVDPETNSFGTGGVQGFEFGSLPTLRSINMNLKVTF
ncbi:MAG: SusC/RagA family TonB-linked outer membrane protein [Bacteroidetes bacterium]|nr:SusC/RagA family TonB-linked outer membrane protein [Bacteroidota bacterium]